MAKSNNLKNTEGTQFSKDNQPAPEAISKGMRKKVVLKDICSQLIKGDSKSALKALAKYLGVEVDEIDLETAMHLKQMELALKEGDTKAYNAVMDRLKGKPKQEVDMTTKGESINPLSKEELDAKINDLVKKAKK